MTPDKIRARIAELEAKEAAALAAGQDLRNLDGYKPRIQIDLKPEAEKRMSIKEALDKLGFSSKKYAKDMAMLLKTTPGLIFTEKDMRELKAAAKKGIENVKETIKIMAEGQAKGLNPERGQPFIQAPETPQVKARRTDYRKRAKEALDKVGSLAKKGLQASKETIEIMGEGQTRSFNTERGQPFVQEKVKIDSKKEIQDFITNLKLKDALPLQFDQLSDAQQLLVLRNLQNRILDIVKSDAQTQYSEGAGGGKSVLKKIWAGIKKEGTIKNLEAETFAKIRDTAEGKQLISQDLLQLTKMAGERIVEINEQGKPQIVFISPIDSDSEEEGAAVERFNIVANNFREIPYEWGQGKGKNKKRYEEAKARYEEARNEILVIDAERVGNEQATTEMLRVDNFLQMEQLVNTHPEVEAEFQRISKTAGGNEAIKTGLNFLQTITGGKNLTNKALFVGGYGLRWATASMGIATGLAAPFTGALVGLIRGRLRGKKTLEERKKEARYGKKNALWDKKKKQLTENLASFDATLLAKKLERLLDPIVSTEDSIDEKDLAALSVRAEYTLKKIENGEVNFGDAKSSLINQYRLMESLNTAMSYGTTSQAHKDLKKRLESFSALSTEKLNERQKKFVNKQMLKGAAYGAGFATAGYIARYFAEHLHWPGQNNVAVSESPNIPETDTVAFRDSTNNIAVQSGVSQDATYVVPRDIDSSNIKPPFGEFKSDPIASHPDTSNVTNDAIKIPEAQPSAPIATPENLKINLDPNAVSHQGDGIETVLRRQIEKDPTDFGFQGNINDSRAVHIFAGQEAHRQALEKGYVNAAGEEIRIREAGSAYQFQDRQTGGGKNIVEFDKSGNIIETHEPGASFEDHNNREDYEYGYKKDIPDANTQDAAGDVRNKLNDIYDEQAPRYPMLDQSESNLSSPPGPEASSAPQTISEGLKALKAWDGATEPNPVNYTRGASDPRFIADWEKYKLMHGNTLPREKVDPNTFLNNHSAERPAVNRNRFGNVNDDNPPEFRNDATYKRYNNPSVFWSYNPFRNLANIAVQQEIVDDIFHGNKLEWNSLRDNHAESILAMSGTKTGNDDLDNLATHAKKLQEITGLKPSGKFLFVKGPENIGHYVQRAWEKIYEMGPKYIERARQ